MKTYLSILSGQLRRSCFTTVQTNIKTNHSAAMPAHRAPLSRVKEVTTVCGWSNKQAVTQSARAKRWQLSITEFSGSGLVGCFK